VRFGDGLQGAVHLAFRVNGKEIASAVDEDHPYLTGTIGLAVGEDGGVSAAEVDNFVVINV